MSKAHKHWPALPVTARFDMSILLHIIGGCMVGFEYVDDFEDEHIIDLNLIYNSCRELKKNFNDISEIIKMFELALMYRTSIHFYF